MSKEYSAGDNIASRCTKCKLVLDHVIVAMTGNVIAKVKCQTCKSTHKFKDPSEPVKVRTPRAKKSTGDLSAATWESALADAKGKEHAYSMVAKYRIGDIVDHQTFGKGIVRKLHMNKCDVLFRDKERLMASAN